MRGVTPTQGQGGGLLSALFVLVAIVGVVWMFMAADLDEPPTDCYRTFSPTTASEIKQTRIICQQ